MYNHIEACPRCTREVLSEDICLYAHEVDYATGHIILHRDICIRCVEEIETRNLFYYQFLFHFEERPVELAKLRGEHYKNRELAHKVPNKAYMKKRGRSRG